MSIIFIIIIALVFQNLFFLVNGVITENPEKIGDELNLIDYKIEITNNIFDIRKDGETFRLKIIEQNNDFTIDGKSYLLSPSIFTCTDESNNTNYLLLGDDLHFINATSQNEIISSLNSLSLKSGTQFFGYIVENKYEATSTELGHRYNIEENEIIVYGLNNGYVFFHYIKENTTYKFSAPATELSCKLLQSDLYICIFDLVNKTRLFTVSHQYTDNGRLVTGILKYIGLNGYYHKLTLYDTDNEKYKVVCVVNNSSQILCEYIYINMTFNSSLLFELKDFEYHTITSTEIQAILKTNEDNCYFKKFNDEYFFCCGGENKIACQRKNKALETIKDFEINIPGNITNLTIENENNELLLTYRNKKEEDRGEGYLYKYHIQFPSCPEGTLRVENIKNVEIKLIEKITSDSKYYIYFTYIPFSDNGSFKLNNETLTSDVIKVNKALTADINILSFTHSNSSISDFGIVYIVSIEWIGGISSKQCPIYIKKICYDSCGQCTIGKIESNYNEQHCIPNKCKSSYYPHVNELTNCYTKDEVIRDNRTWYFDTNDSMFHDCFSTCQNCTEYGENKCITCKLGENNSLYYLYNGQCIQKCPNGTFEAREEDIPICVPCYKNCETCNELGNFTDMKCESCSHDYIKHNNNCYEIVSFEQKTFYINENNSGISSCKQEFQLYILDTGDECISLPGDNYITLNSDTGIISKCYDTCLTCDNKPIYDENNTLLNQSCKECINGYHLLYETSNCYNDSILEDGYYYSSNDLKYHKCDIQCKTCEKNGSSEQLRCVLCNNEKGYYKAKNKPNFECYNNETIKTLDKPYFLSKTDESNSYIWALCYDSCETCYRAGNIDFNNCEDCLSGYYFIEGTNNCVTKEYALNNSYYLFTVGDQDLYKKCDISCKKCNKGAEENNTNCLECNKDEGYYPIDGEYSENFNCFNNYTIKEGYFLYKDEPNFIWKKCYEKCKECDAHGTEENMNCLSCKIQIDPLTNETIHYTLVEKNCLIIYPSDTFITNFAEYVGAYSTNINEYTSTDSVILEYPSNTDEYSLNTSDILECPNNYEKNEDNTKCIPKKFDNEIKASEFKDQISNDITSYVNSSAVINSSDFIAVVMTSDDMSPEAQIKNGISAVDLGNCTQVLKEYYNIPQDEGLIILNMESKKDKNQKNKTENNNDNSFNLGKNTLLEVYDSNGRKLNLSVCTEGIKILKYIGDVEELDIDSAKSFSDQGIDVFNASDEFFNNLCHEYDNNDGKDIVLNDRRTDIYQNATFCQDGCYYTGMNYELMVANCICDSNHLQELEKNITEEEKTEQKEILNFKSIAKSFITSLLDFNFDVVYCSNLMFNQKIIINNFGFFSLGSMQFLQIIFIIAYMIKKLSPIKKYLFNYFKKSNNIKKQNPPPKNKKSKQNGEEKIKYKIADEKEKNKKKEK